MQRLEAVGPPGAGVIGKCERPDKAAEASLGPLEDQCTLILLTVFLALQESNIFIKNNFELK